MVAGSIKEYLDVLASQEPTPGGGSAAALVGALGTALLSMVANLTRGRKKYRQSAPLMGELLREAAQLQADLTGLMVEDAAAFDKVAAVFKMPRDTKEEKLQRRERMQEALQFATRVPLDTMKKAVEALRLHDRSLGHTNPSALSDTGVGALCLKTALQGAWLNVKINLAGISDQEFVRAHRKKGEELLAEGVALADGIYGAVLEKMG